LQSKVLNRNFNDLLKWQNAVNNKKEEFSKKIQGDHMPKILKQSKKILINKNPDYLKRRVEERLYKNEKK